MWLLPKRLAWTVLSAITLISLGSCQHEPPPSPEPWLLRADRLAGRAAVCPHDGSPCRPLVADAQFEAPARVETQDDLSLRLADRCYLDLERQSRASFERGDAPDITLLEGAATLRHDAFESKDPSPVRLKVSGVTVELSPGPVWATARTGDDGFALAVHRGRAVVGSEVVRAGSAVWVSKEGVPDRAAAWTGRMAPVNPVWLPEDSGAVREARGLGRLSARIPGTETVVSGVRLVAHEARVDVRNGFARTEVIEEFHNDTDRVLEGRYVFPLPPRASLSRLALWVGDQLVEGEVVERDRAARIFKNIVDDTVRPRDPALLEWVSGAEFSLKIFPIEPHKSRRVLLAYNEVLPFDGERLSYVHPLSLGPDRSTAIDRFSIEVNIPGSRDELQSVHALWPSATVTRSDERAIVKADATKLVPERDFVVELGSPREVIGLATHVPVEANRGLEERSAGENDAPIFALRLRASLPEGATPPVQQPVNRVIILDTSASQTKETFEAQTRLAAGLIERMDASEQFAILACDTDCAAFPETGLSWVTPSSAVVAATWLADRKLRGASDVEQSIRLGLERLGRGGGTQLVYVGDGVATAGSLDAADIGESLTDSLDGSGVDVRIIGVGTTVDEIGLGHMARRIGATYESLRADDALESRIESVASHLRSPIVSAASLELPDGFEQVRPRLLPNLRLGESFVVVGTWRKGAAGSAKLVGRLVGGKAYALETPLEAKEEHNPVIHRLWAEARIAELEIDTTEDTRKEVIALSKHHHVMSRHTAMLVLENERMFAEFGIDRTQRATPDPPGLSSGPGVGDVSAIDGLGGLGLSGIGEGGGGAGKEIGLGRLGTSGHGSGIGSGASVAGGHRTDSPRVRMGATTVSGRFPPEVIQRIVRQNYGRFRNCYERGLQRSPSLGGRVVVRFVIGSDGTVAHATDGGSTLTDRGVVQCVVQSFSGLSFPAPEGGIVTVTYPILFTPGDAPAGSLSASSPVGSSGVSSPVNHRTADDGWRDGDDKGLAKLRDALKEHPQSRRARIDLVRGCLRHGEFDAALEAAREFASVDPDLPAARELLAHAEAVSGHGSEAVAAIAWLVEGQPRSWRGQLRAARAYEALGQEQRACSHWRTAAKLQPSDQQLRYEAVRCTARALGQREAALRMSRELSGEAIDKLRAVLESGGALPAYDPASGYSGTFEAQLSCAASCPTLIVIAPDGSVFSPWTPGSGRSGKDRVAFRTGIGTYRTLLLGGSEVDKVKLTLRAHDVVRTFDVTGGKLRTVAATDIASWR